MIRISDGHKHDGSILYTYRGITFSDEFYCEGVKIPTFFSSFLEELSDTEIRDDFVLLAAAG
jgi:hypothetical protein